MSNAIRIGRITDPTGQHVFFYAVYAAGWDRFRAIYDRDELLSIEPFEFTDPLFSDTAEEWLDARTPEAGKPVMVLIGSIENKRWVNWNLPDVPKPSARYASA